MSMKYSSKKQKSHPIRSLLLLTQPSVAILAIMVLLMQWRIPTELRITLRTDRPQAAERESLITEMQSGLLPLERIRQIDIRYPDFQNMRPATFTAPTGLELTPLGSLRVREPEGEAVGSETFWQIDGRVSRLRIRSQGIVRDLRMTRFDQLLHSRKAMSGLLSAWVLCTAFGWFKAYQQLKG